MKFIWMFIVCLSAMTIGAATYYVDFAGGLNTNAGTSMTAAWKHTPGDAAATGAPAATLLKAGDNVIFKGGVIYNGQIVVKASGAAAAQITYDGNSAGTWGTGKAVIDGANTRSYGFSASGSVSYVTIKNFEIRNLKYTGVSYAAGFGIKIDNASYVTIANCYIHDVGYWKNDGSVYPAGAGINMVRPMYCLITGNEITRTGQAGVQLNGPQNNTISRNNIHDHITWGIDLGGDYQLCTRNTISDNTIHDLWQNDNGYYGGAGDPPHTDYVFIRKGSGQRPVNNIVERNLFYNNQVFDEFGGTAMLFLSYADSTIIRNNIFINPHGYYAVRFAWTSAGTKFYNNTIYAPNKITGSGGVAGILLETGGKNDIRNNIIITSQTSIALTGVNDESGLVCDYNYFYNTTASQDFVRMSPSRYTTFAGWKALGYDAHSLKAAAVADLRFVNTAGYPTACQTMDLSLQSASPAINAGATLTSFTNDMFLTSRPQSSAWDMGACEYKTGVVVTAPAITAQPANQTVTAGQTAGFSIAASGSTPLTYQWQRCSAGTTTWTSIGGALAAGYTTAAALTTDNGAQFRCVVSNSAGSVTSSAALLTVNVVATPPVVTTQPVNQTVTAGQTAGFSIAASCNTAHTSQWQRCNAGSTIWADISGAQAPSYATATTTADNGAQFRCVVSNSVGSATSGAALLTVSAVVPAPAMKLGGTAFGTSPSRTPGYEYNKASDGNTSTYFMYSILSGGYTGIDLGYGKAAKVTKIRFYPWTGFEFRMNGGLFQGSNLSSSSGYVTLYKVPATPKAGWTEVTLTAQNSYRYLRFASNIYCTIAEMEFYGTRDTQSPQTAALSKLAAAVPAAFGMSQGAQTTASLVTISYAVPAARDRIQFDLYNLKGQLVRSASERGVGAGYHSVNINTNQRALTPGSYVCRMHTEGFNKSIVVMVGGDK